METLQKILAAAALTLGVAAGVAPASAATSAFCEAQTASYKGELETKASSAFNEIDSGIADIRKGGGDPNKIGLKMGDGTFKTLPELRASLLAQKAEVLKEIDDAAANCTKDLKSYQETTDALVTIATGGLNKLLPKRMMHVEIAEILSGKPFGGDGGLVPHFREQVLKVLNLQNDRGFVTNVARDPIRCALLIKKC